jgi:molybdopterin/thiamine biosynthesis adenylyltransferase
LIDALDVASLERFQLELVEAGFEPADAAQRSWVGPIAESVRRLTEAETMKIVFFDGWPFQHPRLIVEGLDERHVSAGGEVCLWATGAPPEEWQTFSDFRARIDEWAGHAATEFRPEDFALDAHLSFGSVRPGTIATVDLESLRLSRAGGGRDEISGTWKQDGRVLEIKRGRKGEIEGRWYFVGKVKVPPRSLDGVRALLDAGQQKNFDRRYRQVAEHGKARLFMLVWERELGREALVLLAEKKGDEVVAQAIEVAPTDMSFLKLRAGPDADALGEKKVVVFGAGAIGSNLSVLLARAGLGELVVVDGDRLRPSNVVRHAANSIAVGREKAATVYTDAHFSSPWTTVRPVIESPWKPSRLRELIAGAELVIETTGLTSFALLVSYICRESGTPLVSAALYRGGAVARVRRQARADDVALAERSPATGHPIIPPGDEPVAYEPGCSEPVNNASPVAVSATAALAAEVAIDTLTERFDYPDEAIDVYRPLDEAPFDRLGRIQP